MDEDNFELDICICIASDFLSSGLFLQLREYPASQPPWKANGPSQIRLTASKRLPASSVVLPT